MKANCAPLRQRLGIIACLALPAVCWLAVATHAYGQSGCPGEGVDQVLCGSNTYCYTYNGNESACNSAENHVPIKGPFGSTPAGGSQTYQDDTEAPCFAWAECY